MKLRDKKYLFNLLLVGLVISELLSYQFSFYRFNSIKDLLLLTLIVPITFFGAKFLIRNKFAFPLFCVFVSITITALIVWAIPQYRGFLNSAINIGFNTGDFMEIRHLFKPYGLLNNDWNALLIVFLPFPIFGAIYFKEWRILFSLLLGIILSAILISGSRGAFLSLIAFLVIILFLGLYFLWPTKSHVRKISSFFLPAFVLCCVMIYPHRNSLSRLNPFLKDRAVSMERSSKGRLQLWRETLPLIRKNPATGLGQKNFPLLANANTTKNQAFIGRVNNTYLELLIEKGILGFLAYGLLFLYAALQVFLKIIHSRKTKQTVLYITLFATLLAVLIRQTTYSSIFHQPLELTFFLLLLFIGVLDIDREATLWKINWVYPILIAGFIYVVLEYKSISQTKLKLEQAVKLQVFDGVDEAEVVLDKVKSKHQNNVLYQLLKTSFITEKEEAFDQENCNLKSLEKNATTLIEGLELANRSIHYLDDMIAHNLGWLYFSRRNFDQAEKSFKQAMSLRPSTGMYPLSLGNFYKCTGKAKVAIDYYVQAILVDPELCLSPFIKKLEQTDSVTFSILREMVLDFLNQEDTIDPIQQAKRAAIYLYLGETETAATILEGVSKQLSNLNRVWYNLALARKKQGRLEEARLCLRKSIFLNPYDYLPYALSAEIEEENNRQLAIAYYKRVLLLYLNLSSDHFAKTRHLYFSTTLKNEVLPSSWLYQSKPYINVKEILQQLSKLLLLEGEVTAAKYFAQLSNSNQSIQSEDILKDTEPLELKKEISPQILQIFESQYPEYVNSSPDNARLLLKTRHFDDFELQLRDRRSQSFRSLDRAAYTQLSLTWHPKGDQLYYQQYNHQIRGFELWKIAVETGKKQLLPCPVSSSAIAPLRWSPTGKYMAYLSVQKNNTLWIYSQKEGKTIKSIAPIDTYADFNWQGDSILWYFKNPKQAIVTSYHLEQQSHQDYSVFPAAEIKAIRYLDKRLYLIMRLPTQSYFQLFTYELGSGKILQISNEQFNLEEVYVTKEKEVIYTQNENGRNIAYQLPQSRFFPREEEQSIGGMTFLQESKAIIKLESSSRPDLTMEVDLKTGNASTLYTPPLFLQDTFAKYIYPIVRKEAKTNIPLLTWCPSTESRKNNKVILYLHGGPHIQFRPIWEAKIEALVRAGFCFIAVNYSGSTGYAKEYEEIESLDLQTQDVLSVIRQLTEEQAIPRENIILMASSYGGKIAFQSASKLDDLGGMVLVSALLPEQLPPRSFSPEMFMAYYGSNDPLTARAYRLLREDEVIASDQFHVFPEEGHFFHRTSSWALICQHIIDTF